VIELPLGQPLSGVVRAAADREPVARLSLRAVQGEDEVGWATTDADGRFRFDGCGPGPVTVSAQPDVWSPFRASGLLPGGDPVELLVKRRDDPRAHGLFLGELHGRAVEAATGAEVTLSVWDVDTMAVPDGDPGALLEHVLNPPVVQRSMAGPLPQPSPAFHVTGLEAGTVGVVLRSRTHAPGFAGPFEVRPGELRAGITVVLGRGGTVSGTVTDAGGRPVAAVVWLTGRGDPLPHARAVAEALGGGDRMPRIRYSECDAAGCFAFRRVPAGPVVRAVAADARGGTAVSAPFTLHDGGTETVHLRLAR
jgi:hypothetical protein